MTVSALKTEVEAMNDNHAARRKFTTVTTGILALVIGAVLFIEHESRRKLEREVAALRLQLTELTTLQQEFASRPAQAPQPSPPLRSSEIDLSELTRLRARQ